jgi:hypothetical protein
MKMFINKISEPRLIAGCAAVIATVMGLAVAASGASAAGLDPNLDWPAFYDPQEVRGLNIRIKDTDWDTILADETFDIEVPALFWTTAEGETEAVLVSIRRKSATPISTKVSFKIDINEYEDEDPRAFGKWHGLKKLSLENGDDMDVVRENLAWYLHRIGSDSTLGVYPVGHTPGLANWATLTAHVVTCPACAPFDFSGPETIEPQGVYVNVEQPDKQFLKNRNLWIDDQTWLYKQDDRGNPEQKEVGGDEDNPVDSPTFLALQCEPFAGSKGKGSNRNGGSSACTADDMEQLINMDIMLAQAGVDAFMANADGIFTHEKNFFWMERSDETLSFPDDDLKRIHYPWDLDESMGSAARFLYGQPKGNGSLRQTDTQEIILGVPAFRATYNG